MTVDENGLSEYPDLNPGTRRTRSISSENPGYPRRVRVSLSELPEYHSRLGRLLARLHISTVAYAVQFLSFKF